MKLAAKHFAELTVSGLALMLVVICAFPKVETRPLPPQLQRITFARHIRIAMLRGLVMDPQNNPLPGSRVTVFIADRRVVKPEPSLDAKEIAWTETNERGAFRFRKLKPGKYRIIIQRSGFNEMQY